MLSPEEQARYDALRRWRNERSKKEGRPAYSLFNNEHLAIIARQNPTSPTALRAIEGVGDARVRHYGEAVIKLLQSLPGAPTSAEAPTQSTAEQVDDGAP